MQKQSYNRYAKARECLLVAFASLLIYMTSPVITSLDSAFTVPTALSLMYEGNADLNEYPDFLASRNPRAVEWIDGRAYSIFPVAISATALPFVIPAEWLLPRLFEWFPALDRLARNAAGDVFELPAGPLDCLALYPAVEWGVASCYAALAAAMLFAMARRRLTRHRAWMLTMLFALGTSMWSTASRGLWQHGPAILMLLAGLWCVGDASRIRGLRGGICLALAYLIRPTFALPAAAIGLYLLVHHRRAAWRYAAGAALPVAAFAVWNLAHFGQPLPPYFNPARLVFSDRTVEALIGNLISPSRGLLIFSPFVLWVFPPMARALRAGPGGGLDFFLALVPPAHLAMLALFYHWWGGYSIGPRLMSDILPILFWFLIPVFALPWHAPAAWHRWAFAAACAWSIGVHGHAARNFAVHYWNERPVSVDAAPERLWDWSDPQFLRHTNPLAAPPAEPGNRK